MAPWGHVLCKYRIKGVERVKFLHMYDLKA